MLNQYLTTLGVSVDQLQDIKKRVYLVGKFNTSDPNPTCFLFTNKKNYPEPNPNGFAGIGSLSYNSFVDKIRPSFTEKFGNQSIPGINNNLPYFTLSPQAIRAEIEGEGQDSSYKIDTSNYFFQRAIATSDHPHFREDRPDVDDILSAAAGQTIFIQIKQNLTEYCKFQQRNYELIQAFKGLVLHNVGRGEINAGYNQISPFPLDFLERFIEYLYSEDQSFSTNGINTLELIGHNGLKDLSEHYKRYLTEGIFGTSKDYSLAYLNQIDRDLIIRFKKARKAYNMLQQIVRSRVLLSMVLQWSIEYFETLPSVKKDEPNKFKVIEEAILKGEMGKNGEALLMTPIEREEGVTKQSVIVELRRFTPIMLRYIAFYPKQEEGEDEKAYQDRCQSFEEDEVNKKSFNSLLKPIQEMVNQTINEVGENGLKGHGLKKQNIEKVINDEQSLSSFVNSINSYFIDVIIPRFFKEPGIGFDDLRSRYKGYEENLFINVVLRTEGDFIKNDEIFKNADAISEMNEIIRRLGEGQLKMVSDKTVAEEIKRTQQALLNENLKRGLGLTGYSPTLLPPKADPYEQPVIASRTHNEKSKIEKLSGDVLKSLSAGSGNGQKALPKNSNDQKALPENIEKVFMDERNLKGWLQKYNNADLAKKDEEGIVALKKITDILKGDIEIIDRKKSLISSIYSEAPSISIFRKETEAMALTRLLILHAEELSLDKPGTHLFDLLLDLVEELDSTNPDLAKFWKKHSLTKYIDKTLFSNPEDIYKGMGFSALKTVLKNQASDSLKNVIQVVSELHGVKYLFDQAGKQDSGAEIIVVNANWQEFMNWVGNNRNQLLKPNSLSALPNQPNPYFPVMIYMTDLAFEFNESNKNAFAQALSAGNLNKDPMPVFPPICLSTASYMTIDWDQNGRTLATLADNSVAPLSIIGPSLPLNSNVDTVFSTVLYSGYILCTHFLKDLGRSSTQRLVFDPNELIGKKSSERFRVLFNGADPVNTPNGLILNSTVNRSSKDGKIEFTYTGDHYLYLLKLIEYIVENGDIGGAPSLNNLYKDFTYDLGNPNPHNSSNILNGCMLDGKATDWSLVLPSNDNPNYLLQLFPTSGGPKFMNTQWFNN
ncbi:hypothetical protein Q0590_28265 [Rhodocytophaga aerolata]|uniref:Uncharacterized protein n=1 Tax=Rhodocytophaga aerolata TaxID=455078 RepID=A0ABT8RGD6_9BACT|nr:hypothetical protein [Rhodocytophaga aerolata]MDO1450208.1 hypothetical protein [Rhodocytophaga aerolata]